LLSEICSALPGREGKFHLLISVTSTEVGYRKPDPHGYLELARRLDVRPEMMVFVGNEEKDVIGANQADMRSVLLDREQTNASDGETWRISSLAELSTLLLPQTDLIINGF
jgi:putative hydrolase of the HAD superfamily